MLWKIFTVAKEKGKGYEAKKNDKKYLNWQALPINMKTQQIKISLSALATLFYRMDWVELARRLGPGDGYAFGYVKTLKYKQNQN